MAIIRPFAAIRPSEKAAETVACVPYDVVHEHEVRELIEANPQSFLRVTRPEGELDGPASEAAILAKARQNLDDFLASGLLIRDAEPAIYIYRLSIDDQRQTGIVACCSLEEYDAGSIKKHEKTRPDKVADRTDHMMAVGAQTGLIFLTIRNTDKIESLIATAVKREPIYSFRCTKGVLQEVWRVTETDGWVRAFRDVPAIYVADGHHRIESAKLARDRKRSANPDHTGEEEYNFVMAGIFPAEDLRILPYNRAVKDLNGLDTEEFFAQIRRNFILVDSIDDTPDHRGEISMYYRGAWYKLRFNPAEKRELNAIERLDVSVLQDHLLAPVLGIGDPRTDTRISFIGGARGTEELMRLVDSGEAAVAFSMFATTMDDLLAVSDMGEIMPPKSTWFEPKLKDGLFVHEI